MKVAAYCRVSTEYEDQTNSFETQKRFFKEYIERNPDWELYEIYADEGLSGTSTRDRKAFNRMIADINKQGPDSEPEPALLNNNVHRIASGPLETVCQLAVSHIRFLLISLYNCHYTVTSCPLTEHILF